MRIVMGAAGQGYTPLQSGRTPESSLKTGLAKGERNVRALVERDSKIGKRLNGD